VGGITILFRSEGIDKNNVLGPRIITGTYIPEK
jgi:hypothetical protein